MNSLPERIAQIIEDKKLTKAAFAKALNVSGAFVTEMCSGRKNPSDRTIQDICRVFGVDEVWLRTGEGDMYRSLSREEEIARYMGDLLGGNRTETEEAFIATLSKFSPEMWQSAEKMLDMLIEEYSKAKKEKHG